MYAPESPLSTVRCSLVAACHSVGRFTEPEYSEQDSPSVYPIDRHRHRVCLRVPPSASVCPSVSVCARFRVSPCPPCRHAAVPPYRRIVSSRMRLELDEQATSEATRTRETERSRAREI